MFKNLSLNLENLIKIFVIFAILLQVPDLVGTSDFIQHRFILTSNSIMFGALILFAIFRFIYREQIFSVKIGRIFKFLFIVLFSLSLIFTFLDQINYINFVYSHTRINYDQLGFLGAGFGLLWLLCQPAKFFSKYSKQLIFITPILLMLFFALMSFWPFDVLQRALHEDGPVEFVQFLMLVGSLMLSSLIALKLFSKKKIFLSLVFVLAAVGLFFIAGEEISWGQRLLSLATPDRLAEVNRQKEIGIHNIYTIESIFFISQIIASLYLGLAFLIKPFLKNYIDKRILNLFIPQYYYLFFFIPMPIYFATEIKVIYPLIPEIFELLLYTGITVFLLETYIKSLYFNRKSK